MENVCTSKLIHSKGHGCLQLCLLRAAGSVKKQTGHHRSFFGNFWRFFLSLQNIIMKRADKRELSMEIPQELCPFS